MANKPLFMRHLSVSPVPNLGKTMQSPQSDLTTWILTLIQVVVILLQLYLVIWKSKLRSEANLSKRSTQNPEQHRRIFESSFLASWVIFTPMIWSSCLNWHSTPFVYCSDGDEPIQNCILLKYRISHLICGSDT